MALASPRNMRVMTTAMATPSMARMKKRMNGFMMPIPGCVDVLKVVAAELLSIQLCAGFQYPVAGPTEPYRRSRSFSAAAHPSASRPLHQTPGFNFFPLISIEVFAKKGRYRYIKSDCGGCSSVGRAPGCGPGCRGFKPHHSPHLPAYAPVAQLDRAPDFESVGRGFESLRARQNIKGLCRYVIRHSLFLYQGHSINSLLEDYSSTHKNNYNIYVCKSASGMSPSQSKQAKQPNVSVPAPNS